MDEATQCQCVCAVERIGEAYLLPVLEAMMTADVATSRNMFPFAIRGFHSDNGSEYVDRQVANLLEKLPIEQTYCARSPHPKSRSRQTNDNALAESKNASTARKHLGYSHIPQHLAGAANAFTAGVLSPYPNFHRPCHFPTEFTDQKGKVRKRYRYADMTTPYDKLKSLADAARYLKPGTTFKRLDEIASECSDNEAAKRLNEARAKLFQLINKSRQRAA